MADERKIPVPAAGLHRPGGKVLSDMVLNIGKQEAETNRSVNAAKTIHSMVYQLAGFNQDIEKVDLNHLETSGQFYLVFEPVSAEKNKDKSCVYIVDEASMISDVEQRVAVQASFGSGRVLKELLKFDARPDSRFIFVGDPCQLPPIVETITPALMPEYFQNVFGITPCVAQLTEIMRQDNGNDIIKTSNVIREKYAAAPDSMRCYLAANYRDYLPFSGCNNIILHHNENEMVEDFVAKQKEKGYAY